MKYNWCIFFAALALMAGCQKDEQAKPSAQDPLPLPEAIEANKDRSVNPGDSFFDYCNGTWIQNTAIPESGTTGGIYRAEAAMQQRVEELKTSNPDISRFYALAALERDDSEKVQQYMAALKVRFPQPQTREAAFTTMGKMIADGIMPWPDPLSATFRIVRVNGKLMGAIIPPKIKKAPKEPQEADEPGDEVPEVKSLLSLPPAYELIVKGMGLDPTLFVMDDSMTDYWNGLEDKDVEELWQIMQDGMGAYEKYGERNEQVLSIARVSLCYTLSYQLIQRYVSAQVKEKYLNITREIKSSLRERIQKVTWMSETTRSNALDKLDACRLYVAYPDQWHMDGVAKLADCETLVEAIHHNNRGLAAVKGHLIGGNDEFTYQMLQNMTNSDGKIVSTDLTMVNAMYNPKCNSIFMFPGFLLPPLIPENVSLAYEYAALVTIGHEFTHGFDTLGAQYDKDGYKRNWWTVADKMAFEDRRDILVRCYNHLEMDPVRLPGEYGRGERTQTEDIADLGGFLTVLDAYQAYLTANGYTGDTYREQLKKFYESYANVWCVQYSDQKLALLKEQDAHSCARLRVNGVVMNTDLWYDLYEVDRNKVLYLPPENRAYIW